jgi:hypothetical protein
VNGRPDNLLDDSGDISVDDSGTKTWTVSPQLALAASELYWMGIHKSHTDATGSIRINSPSEGNVIGMSDGYVAGNLSMSLQATGQTTSAPADPFPATHSLNSTGAFLMIEVVDP